MNILQRIKRPEPIILDRNKIDDKEAEALELLRYRKENNPVIYRQIIRLLKSSTDLGWTKKK